MTSLIKGPTGKPLRVGLADKLGIAKQGGETGGGIAASASSVDAVIEAVRRVTGIKATSGAARVSELGMDSLSLMRLSHALRGLGGSSEVDKLLLADATIDTLAVAVARPAAAAAEKKIDLDPVFGLRSLFCLFVVRGCVKITLHAIDRITSRRWRGVPESDLHAGPRALCKALRGFV